MTPTASSTAPTEPVSQQTFLEAAKSAGRDLVDSASADNPAWIPSAHGRENASENGRDAGSVPTFYYGAAGVGFFFSHLTALTDLPDVCRCMQTVVSRLLQRAGSQESDSWMHGRLGTALTAFEAGRLHDRPAWRDAGLDLALGADPERFPNCDVFGGPCGAALLLTYMYRRTGEDRLLDRSIELSRFVLSEQVGTSPYGLYLRRSSWPVFPLTGLGHGTSGLALMSDELHALTGAPVYRYVARSAIAFEDSLYDEDASNWVDGRTARSPFTDASTREALDEYEDDRFASYRTPLPTQRTAWCNGKPGLIAARLRALEHERRTDPETVSQPSSATNSDPAPNHLSGTIPARRLSDDTIASPDKLDTDVTVVDNFAYCCGYAGLAESYLYAATVLDRPRYAHRARRIGTVCVNRYRETGQWLAPRQQDGLSAHSFMRGRAGVGYLMLRLARPDDTVSPLVPSRSATEHTSSSAGDPPSLRAVRSRVLRSYWSTTLDALSTDAPSAESGFPFLSAFLDHQSAVHAGRDLQQFNQRLSDRLAPMEEADAGKVDREEASTCYRAELDRFTFDRNMRTTVDRGFEYRLLGRPNLATHSDAVLRMQRDVDTYPIGDGLLVFHLLGGETQLNRLRGFAARILNQFDAPKQVGPLRNRIVEANEHLPDDRLKGTLNQLLQKLVAANVLQLTPEFLRTCIRSASNASSSD